MKTALMFLVAVAAAGVPGVANAATVSVDHDTAVYRAAPREANALGLVNAFGPLTFADFGAPLTAGRGCAGVGTVSCDARDIDATLGDRADKAQLNCFIGAVALDAGTGDDDVLVGANDDASATGGPGDDTIVLVANGGGTGSGGSGNDALASRSGATDIAGDAGSDLLTVGPGRNPAKLSGDEGADRLVGSQAAELLGGSGGDVLVGGASIEGGSGNDRIQSAGGATISGGSGADLIDAADGSGTPDTISCGSGLDAVWVDAGDTVAQDCELQMTGPAPPLPGVAGAISDAQALLTHTPTLP
jgi:Ca2+-binding RTX toxin-like protein